MREIEIFKIMAKRKDNIGAAECGELLGSISSSKSKRGSNSKSAKVKKNKTTEFRDCLDPTSICSSCKDALNTIESDDKTYDEYIDKLIDDVDKMINNGSLNLDPAKVGIDTRTFAIIWNKTKLSRLMISAGFCPHCTSEFITYMSLMTDKDGKLMNIIMIDVAEETALLQEIEFAERNKTLKI